jgi:hypothetical protein
MVRGLDSCVVPCVVTRPSLPVFLHVGRCHSATSAEAVNSFEPRRILLFRVNWSHSVSSGSTSVKELTHRGQRFESARAYHFFNSLRAAFGSLASRPHKFPHIPCRFEA